MARTLAGNLTGAAAHGRDELDVLDHVAPIDERIARNNRRLVELLGRDGRDEWHGQQSIFLSLEQYAKAQEKKIAELESELKNELPTRGNS